MEEGARDADSDETVIEGSVTESDQDDDELPWRRLLFNKDTACRSEFSPRPGVNGMWKGIHSPEIQHVLKLRKNSEEQKNKKEVMQTLSEDTMLQELREDRDSPETSLLSGTIIRGSDLIALKEKLLTEPAVSNAFSEPGKEVTLTTTSKETKDEESSLETFVSALEKLLGSPASTQDERLLEIINDFDPGELMNPLSNSSSSILAPLNDLPACSRDLLEGMKDDDALTLEWLTAISTLPDANIGPICQGQEQGSSVSGGNECLEVKPGMSQMDEDCTQIAQTVDDPKSFGFHTLTHKNATSYKILNNNENSDPVKNTSVKGTPCVRRRSSRLEKLRVSRDKKHRDDTAKVSERVLPKTLDCVEQINNKSPGKNFRMQNSVLITKGKRNSMYSSRLKSEQIKKNEQLTIKNVKKKIYNMSLSNINRRNIFGENLLYRAVLHNDADLVHHCIKNGGKVNQPSYAGWTALHEASVGGFYRIVRELLKGGADVNIKGMYQITPLHDAVINGHHKVAELLLLNGADPLFRSDHGTCALDEAKDSYMKNLLKKYVPKYKNCHVSARRKNTNPAYVEDVQQYKKPRYSSNNHTEFVHDKNSNRQNPRHVEINKGSKDLLTNIEGIYEHYQKDFRITKFHKPKHKQSTVDQMHSIGLRKDKLHSVRDNRTSVSERKGRGNMQHRWTQVDDRVCSLSQEIAISSSRRMNTLATHEQHTLQTLDDLPEESCEFSTPTLSSLKNGFDGNNEACLASEESRTHNLDLSSSQEVQCLELESIDQTKAASFSGLSLYKEIKFPVVTKDQQPPTNQEQCSNPCQFPENYSSDNKGKNINEWENSFVLFIKGHVDNDGAHCTSEMSITSKIEIHSVEYTSHCNNEETRTNREEMDTLQCSSSEMCISRENDLKTGSPILLQQQKAISFCDSDNTFISEQHVANCEQYIYETSFDHSHTNTDQTFLPCTRLPLTHEISKLTSQVELLEKSQDNAPKEPTPLINQTDTDNVENKQDNERNHTMKGQTPSSSNSPFPTVVHSQVTETTKVEKRREDLPENETMCNIDFHSTGSMKKKLANISQLNQREEKEIYHKSEELTNTRKNESAVRNCKEKKEKIDSEIHMPPNSQEHRKDQNFKKSKKFLKAACSQEVNTARIHKRNAKGESQLHLASRRGNLSLVKSLIESGADVNLKDNAGWTPLHEASNKGFSDIILELLKSGAKVNSENVDGILPLHDAAVGNHLKAAEILLEHGANPNKKDQNQKTALDEADDEKMKELLKLYGAVESNNGDESNSTVTVKIPDIQPKRYKQCTDDNKTVDPPAPFHQAKRSESLPVHQTISAILRDIEEKQDNLLEFEIRNPEDAEQYIGKMLEIKEVMDNILAQQKTERDDLAKKYRVSMDSFKHGALREQLANLATRQKSLLVVAKKQKKIRSKIQNYKTATPFSSLSLRKLPCNSDNRKLTSVENSVHSQSGSCSLINVADRSMQEVPWDDSQNTNTCLNSESARREEFSRNEVISKQNVQHCTLGGLLKSRHSNGPEKMKLSSQPVAFIDQVEYSQEENVLTETMAKGHEFDSSPAVTSTINISEDKSVFSQNDTCPATVTWDQDLSHCDPKRRNKKRASQQPPGGLCEPLAQQGITVLATNTAHQAKPCLKETASSVSHAEGIQISSSSRSIHQHSIKKPLNHNTAPKKKSVQLKDLILLGRIKPGNNILEFKTQETTHKASILLSGKLKVESGQIYQSPVTWLKDLLGGNSYVTWNYAWSKVTYLGKELLKYVSEDVPAPPEPNNTAQHHHPCLPGTSRKSVESIPHYLQIKEILLISDQEFLPSHVMDQHWKFYVECEELEF
ncbi:putative ankyrin repeat domain-containing protein 31 isoform X2 [Nannospalax galili]|uniref:putative ankyrin repeat domain-containing protein 31 isoform X2 n=1 Tax=Nannospalax galili TaxID=1026970 RepID=UPI00111BE5AF|nr:putative ankyrin repeat domain-containing protein 31 isoform X2 [Nannospalax galili]